VALDVVTMGLQPHYVRLKEAWFRGERSRESDLDLMFHAWMHWADPPFVTGLEGDPDAQRIWHEIYEQLGGLGSSDAEFLFVAKVMATVTPWALGDEAEWNHKASELERRLRTSGISRLHPNVFEGRGEYGKYFSHQLSIDAPPNISLERARER
jgi:hypothetical protein